MMCCSRWACRRRSRSRGRPISGRRGTVRHRKFTIDRGGYDGPLEVRLADRQARHLQGVVGPVLTVPAGATEFDYPVTLPPWMETGRTSRAVIMAIGTIRDADGQEYEVSASTTHPDLQIIAVVEPGRLAIETGRASVMVRPGGTVACPSGSSAAKASTGPRKSS